MFSRSTAAHLILVAALSASTLATPNRGTWFWNNTTLPDSSTSPHSASMVVGDSAKEDDEIAFMGAYGITKVYGSYGTGPGITTERPKYRAWNAKLDAAGIESQLLISAFEPGDVAKLTDPDHVNLVGKVTDRLIDFNDEATLADEEFKALHLDIEPQTLTAWTTGGGGTPAIRRGFLDDLLDVYVDIRAALDAGGYSAIPIYADIPWNWSKYPSPTIGWASEADRNGWYAAVSAVIDGASIMTFTPSKDTFAEIDDATDYERTGGFFTKPARVGIQAKVGSGEIWPTYADFTGIVDALDAAFGPDEATDIENYAFWRYVVEEYGPTLTTSTTLTADPDTAGGGVISFPALPGHVYTVRGNSDLSDKWQVLARVRTSGALAERIEVPVQMPPPRGFFYVTEEKDR